MVQEYYGKGIKIRAIEHKVNPTDVLVIDESTNSARPEYKIINSYRVKTILEKWEILKIIKNYDEKNHKSKWSRSFRTLLLEWITHNFLYTVNYERDRTTDVDLDNDDEEQYRIFTKK